MCNYNEMGNKIKSERETQKLSQNQLALLVGVAPSTIQRYENGTFLKPKLPVIESIAKCLCVSPEWLIGKSNIKDSMQKDDQQELNEYLEELRTRPEMRMMFSLTKNATKEDVEKAVKIVEALLKNDQ